MKYGRKMKKAALIRPANPQNRQAGRQILKKSQEKPGDWDLQTWRFTKYVLNEIKMDYFLFQGILYPGAVFSLK